MSRQIVILINSLSGGGAERVVSTLLNHWAGKYDCYLILMENQVCYDLDPRIRLFRLNEKPNYNGLIKLIRLPLIGFRLYRIIKQYHFHQVASFLTRANYVNILAKTMSSHRVIISERSFPSQQYGKGGSGRLNRLIIRKLYPRADLLITNSMGNGKDLEKNFSCRHISVIPNPSDLEKIKINSKITIEQYPKKTFTWITVGRLDEGKNHLLLINAMKETTAVLEIIGEGSLASTLKDRIRTLGLEKKIFLLGYRENPFPYLSKADGFVFSSNSEGFPNALIEALACGLPVISTDCLSGPREILAPGTDIDFQLKGKIEIAEYGILTPVNDEERMREAMDLLINDTQLRASYEAKAKKRAQDFSVEKIATQYEKILCAP